MSEANSMTHEERMANFDPSDPEQLAALEKELFGEVASQEGEPVTSTETEDTETDGETSSGTDQKEAKTDEKQAGEAPATGATSSTEPQEKGVQARDGKHIIPYSVLERERERAARAEAMLQEQARQIDQLKSGKSATGSNESTHLTEDDLVQLEQDLPGVAKVIRAQMAAIEHMNDVIASVQTQQQAQEEVAARKVEDEIEAAIVANPALASWRDAAARSDNPDPRMWNRAADIDRALREDPEFQDLTVAERFARVVKSVESIYGKTEETPQQTTPSQQTKQPAVDLKQVADAKLKAASAVVPMSLSDIPGGAPPAQGFMESLENASAVALGNRFLSMTADQIESELARLG